MGKATIIHEVKEETIVMGLCLTVRQQLALVHPFSGDDVKNTLFSISSHKSPDPSLLATSRLAEE